MAENGATVMRRMLITTILLLVASVICALVAQRYYIKGQRQGSMERVKRDGIVLLDALRDAKTPEEETLAVWELHGWLWRNSDLIALWEHSTQRAATEPDAAKALQLEEPRGRVKVGLSRGFGFDEETIYSVEIAPKDPTIVPFLRTLEVLPKYYRRWRPKVEWQPSATTSPATTLPLAS
jgi:hypothetical protein